MENNTDNLRSLFDKLKTINFWQRLFGWKQVKSLLIDAYGDLQRLLAAYSTLKETVAHEATENRISKEGNAVLTNRNAELQAELATIRQKISGLEEQLKIASTKNTELVKEEEFRRKEHSNALASLQSIQKEISDERQKEISQKTNEEIEKLRKQKDTWSNHQLQVQLAIKTICNNHTIEYVDKVPFRGEPDNTIKICDEYVVFDAKSPAGEDLNNFPAYIKDQAERAKKYARQDAVKTDIFFVVPSNTLEVLSTFVYRISDYNVYIISTASLEPVILSLKKIEEYEFAEQLSPEERENICRILGKFAHLSKRRIQVDSFFAKQFIELAYKSENDLPTEIHDKMIAFERAEKLNPPTEKRAKEINLKELEKETNKLSTDANAKGIYLGDISAELNGLPLYTSDNKE
ncbi:MAG: hypothetical protein JSS96_01455 [Bacteroidetes bacterium]|nr:hypothetical protein [Bacteroidota bacterium]